MKIAIMGFSGAGKSTLARRLAEHHDVEALHLDTVQFLPNWVIRAEEDKRRLVLEFMDSHEGWVIDGNYSALHLDRRLEEADLIILLLFDRISCLWRVTRRYFTYRGRTRPDMGEGCSEKLDLEFIRWVLHGGRTRKTKARFKARQEKYPHKTVVLKNQRQLDKWLIGCLASAPQESISK